MKVSWFLSIGSIIAAAMRSCVQREGFSRDPGVVR